MNLLLATFLLLALYVIPGFFFSRLFDGRVRNSIFVWILFSFLLVPFFYMFLVHTGLLSLEDYLLTLAAFGTGCFLLARSKLSKTNLDEVLKDNLSAQISKKAHLSIGVVLLVFFLMLISPRIGLWKGFVPIGDDRPRVGQVLSIAASPHLPVHFRLPGTQMSIYYFNMVQPGLLTRLTDNFVKVNQSWFLHLFVSYLLFVWFIRVLVYRFSGSYLSGLVMTFSMTLAGGLEYFLSRIRNINYAHLEWWTDWFFPGQSIHMQISSPFTSAFWVTQHTFAALLTLFVYLIISSNQKNKMTSWVLLGLILGAIAGNSIFVFIALFCAYVLYYIIRLLTGLEKFSNLLKTNLIIGVIFLTLFSSIAYIYLGSGKQDYFVLMMSVFHFFDNQGLNKIFNIILSVPIYLLVELNLLLFVYIYSLYKLFKDKLWKKEILFLYLLTLPFIWMFFVRAKGDNNLSMRGTLPGLIVIGIFAGLLIDDMGDKFKNKYLFKLLISGFLLLLIPTTFYEYSTKLGDQFHPRDAIYQKIDETLPLNALVFIDEPVPGTKNISPDHLTHLGHRLTFKPVEDFDITDIEYTNQIAKDKYSAYSFSYLGEILELLEKEKDLSNLPAYLVSERVFDFPQVLVESNFKVYRIRD